MATRIHTGLPAIYVLLLVFVWSHSSAQGPEQQELVRGLAELIKSERPTTETDLERNLKVSLRTYETERLTRRTVWKGDTSSPIHTIVLSDLVHTPALSRNPATDSQTTIVTLASSSCISGDALQAVLGFAYHPYLIPPSHVHNRTTGTTELTGGGQSGYWFHVLSPSLETSVQFNPRCSSSFTITKRFRR
jgi:hypothetical protein